MNRILIATVICAWLSPIISFAQPVPVTVAALADLTVAGEYRAPAEVVPRNQALLAAEISAVISLVHADVGQALNAGDLIIELDQTDYQLALQQAQADMASIDAQLEQARARLKRAQDLNSRNYASEDELLQRETDVQVLLARRNVQKVVIAQARRQIRKCRIVAPFDGVITERQAQVGSYVNPGSPLAAFVQSDGYEVESDVSATLADTLSSADSLRFVTERSEWSLNLLRLSPVINAATRTQTVRFEFTDNAPAIGTSGELHWSLPARLLPADLLVRRGERYGVFIEQGGQAEFVELPNADEGRPASVDLPPDTRVIVDGRGRVQHGDTISIGR